MANNQKLACIINRQIKKNTARRHGGGSPVDPRRPRERHHAFARGGAIGSPLQAFPNLPRCSPRSAAAGAAAFFSRRGKARSRGQDECMALTVCVQPAGNSLLRVLLRDLSLFCLIFSGHRTDFRLCANPAARRNCRGRDRYFRVDDYFYGGCRRAVGNFSGQKLILRPASP